MIHTAKITQPGLHNAILAQAEFEAPDNATKYELLVLAGKAIGDYFYLEVEPGPTTPTDTK